MELLMGFKVKLRQTPVKGDVGGCEALSYTLESEQFAFLLGKWPPLNRSALGG